MGCGRGGGGGGEKRYTMLEEGECWRLGEHRGGGGCGKMDRGEKYEGKEVGNVNEFQRPRPYTTRIHLKLLIGEC